MQRAHFAELVPEALPMAAAVIAAIELPEVRTHEDELRVRGIRCHAPRRAVQRSGQLARLPSQPAIAALEQAAGTPGRAVAIAEKDATAIGARHDGARVLPRRIELLEMPGGAVVLARVQAAIGGREHPIFRYGDAMHIGRDQPMVGALPMLAAVIAAQDAADLHRRPNRRTVENNLRHARRAAIDFRELGDPRRIELAPRAPATVGAMERRSPASGEQDT